MYGQMLPSIHPTYQRGLAVQGHWVVNDRIKLHHMLVPGLYSAYILLVVDVQCCLSIFYTIHRLQHVQGRPAQMTLRRADESDTPLRAASRSAAAAARAANCALISASRRSTSFRRSATCRACCMPGHIQTHLMQGIVHWFKV